MVIGARITERMEAMGLSQAELARRVGVSQPTIYNLIHKAKKGSTKLHIIARVLRTTPAYLTGETDDPASDQPEDSLSAEDREDLSLLQKLPSRDRDSIRQLMRSLSERAPAIPAPAPTAARTLHSPSRSFAGKDAGKGEAA